MDDPRMQEPTSSISAGTIQPGSEVVDLDGKVVGTVTEVGDDSFIVKSGGLLGGTMRIRRDLVLASEEGHIDLRVSRRDLGDT